MDDLVQYYSLYSKMNKYFTKTAEATPPAPPVDEEVAAIETTLNDQFNEFMAKLHQVGAQFSSLKSEFKALEKRCTKEVKVAQKANAKKKRRAGTRTPSGFVKPTLISAELIMAIEPFGYPCSKKI